MDPSSISIVGMLSRRNALVGVGAGLMGGSSMWSAASPGEVWRLNSLNHVGEHKTIVEGRPHLAEGAISFNGVDDAIFIDVHPLAGAREFTWEVIFRPARDGAAAQRFFHLQENDTDNRMLFETRMVEGRWCLDTFVKAGDASATLLDMKKLHSAGQWHHAAAVCNGHELRNYVDGIEQGAAPLAFAPHKQGRTSLGVRINRKDYFKGEIRMARMTKSALALPEFLKA